MLLYSTWAAPQSTYICIRFFYKSFVLHLYLSVYKSFCAAPVGVCLEEPVLDLNVCFLGATGRVSVLQLYVSVYNSFVLHLDVPFY